MIHTLYWDLLEKGQNTILLIWPGPIDHDECFRKAGFNDFADSDEKWDSDFKKVVERIIDVLKPFGELHIENEIKPNTSIFQKLFGKKRPDYNLIEQIILSTQYACPNYKVRFGNVSLRTGNEHQLFIIHLPDKKKINNILNHVAEDLNIKLTKLNWSKIEKL